MKTVIFDMDGVIFDSERAVFAGWQELAEKYGFKQLEIPYRRCIGVNAAASKQIFLDFYGEDFPYDLYCREQSENYHAKYDNGNLPMKKGVRELLTALKSEGYRTAIASSTRTAVVKHQIEAAGLLSFFDCIIGGDMVEKSKPNPDIFLKAAETLGGTADGTYVIEDSYNGIRAAHAAGMIPVMVPDMLPPDEEMREKAAYILDDLSEVRKLLCKEKASGETGRMNLRKVASDAEWRMIKKLYKTAFPASERKPFWLMQIKHRQQKADIWVIENEGEFSGFAITINGGDMVLLDYFVISGEKRGLGLGGKSLRLLKDKYKDKRFFLEIESLSADADNMEERCRRKQFYLNNGMTELDVKTKLFGVEFELLGYDCDVSYAEYYSLYDGCYGRWATKHLEEIGLKHSN